MTNANNTFRIEVLVKGRWLVTARRVSVVERDAICRKIGTDPSVRVLPE